MSRWLACLMILALPLFVRAADEPKKDPPDREKLLKATPEEFIKAFDKNKDGSLDKDEMPLPLARAFEKADRNKDGKLDAKEIEELQKVLRDQLVNNAKPDLEKGIAGILERLDTNKDGKISKDEAKGPLTEAFARLDKNNDGFLDKEELRPIAERLGAGARLNGQPNPVRGPDFDSLDKDADGRLTKDELKGTPLADKFDEVDANKDGKIDRKEFENFVKKP
jgi:Ca2+-binding EF-hand superfamily protein